MSPKTKKLYFIAVGCILAIGIILYASYKSHLNEEEDQMSELNRDEKRQFIRGAFRQVWKNFGMTSDQGDLGSPEIAITGLSTLFILGLDTEYTQIKAQLPHHLDMILASPLTHQTIEKCLSGLLSAYALSDDPVFLNAAERIAQLMVGPDAEISLPSEVPASPAWVGDLLLAYDNLRRMTGKSMYNKIICHLQDYFFSLTKPDHLTDPDGKQMNDIDLLEAFSWFQFYLINAKMQKSGPAGSYLAKESQLHALSTEYVIRLNLFRKPVVLKVIATLPYPLNFERRKEAQLGCTMGVSYALSSGKLPTDLFGTSTESHRMQEACFKAAGDFIPEVHAKAFLLNRRFYPKAFRTMTWDMEGLKRLAAKKLPPCNFLKVSASFKFLYLVFTDDTVMALDKWVFNSAGQPLPIYEQGEDLDSIYSCNFPENSH